MKANNKVVVVWPDGSPFIEGYPVFWSDSDFVRVFAECLHAGLPDVVGWVMRTGHDLGPCLLCPDNPVLPKGCEWHAKRIFTEVARGEIDDLVEVINDCFCEALARTGCRVELRATRHWARFHNTPIGRARTRERQNEYLSDLLKKLNLTMDDVWNLK